MTRFTLPAAVLLLLAGCTTAQQASVQSAVQTAAKSQAGQLFCQLDTSAGEPVVVTLVDAALSSSAGPVPVLVNNALASTVQAECAQAAANVGATAGIPISPVTVPVGSVAITVAPNPTAKS